MLIISKEYIHSNNHTSAGQTTGHRTKLTHEISHDRKLKNVFLIIKLLP